VHPRQRSSCEPSCTFRLEVGNPIIAGGDGLLKVMSDAFVDSPAPLMPTELELAPLEDLGSLRRVEALVPAPTPANWIDADSPPSSGNSDVAQQSDFGICHSVLSPSL
jgi:hypothetical protein